MQRQKWTDTDQEWVKVVGLDFHFFVGVYIHLCING